MHKLAVIQVHAYVRHLSVDAEEHDIAWLQLTFFDRCGTLPQARRGPRDRPAYFTVGEIDKTTAVEARRRRAAVSVGNPDLRGSDARRT